jgi:multiple sugar transport system ATP-binding protein
MTEIVLDGVGKRFGEGTRALSDIAFTIRDGEFFVLVGPSGCGKSTLLNIIVGLEKPTSGEIRIGGVRANEIDARERNMAMVFQNYAIYPHMSVRENLAFPLRMARLGKDEIARRVEQAARSLELFELLDRRPASLSGGQRQRVAMGRAIVREPAAFLLDEPLSNLDARLRDQTRVEIARLQKRLGVTTVYVTHDQNEAMTLGDRIAVMREGLIQQIGTPRELYESPANLFVAGFIGSPAFNLFPANAHGAGLALPGGTLEVSERQRAALERLGEEGRGGLVAGIRPEHLSVAAQSSGRNAIRARVEIVEWTGADKLVHFLPMSAGHGERAVAEGTATPRGVGRGASDANGAEDTEIVLEFAAEHVRVLGSRGGRRVF